MISLIKQLVENVISLFQKLKFKLSCCNTTVDVRVIQSIKTPSNKSL